MAWFSVASLNSLLSSIGSPFCSICSRDAGQIVVLEHTRSAFQYCRHVFVDIGVGKAGLIPIRHVTEAKLSKTKKRTSLGLGPGERVEVQVLNIDVPRSRITLDLIRVL